MSRLMSRNKPVEIKIEETLTVRPDAIFQSEVVKSGNGAVIKAFKRHIGKKAIVIIKEDKP